MATGQEKLVSDLKEKYGTVYKVELEKEGSAESVVGYFKELDFKTASVVAKLAASDPFGSSKILVQNTIIQEHSHKEFLDNWKMTVSAGQELQRVFELPNVSVAKL